MISQPPHTHLQRANVHTYTLFLDIFLGDHWPEGHSACVLICPSWKKGKEKERNFLIWKKGRHERPPHSKLVWMRASERGKADRIFSSEEQSSDGSCVYTGVLRAWQVKSHVPQHLTINTTPHRHVLHMQTTKCTEQLNVQQLKHFDSELAKYTTFKKQIIICSY